VITWHVDGNAAAGGDGTTAGLSGEHCAFQSIKAGIDAASGDGDVVSVATGTYTESTAYFDGTHGNHTVTVRRKSGDTGEVLWTTLTSYLFMLSASCAAADIHIENVTLKASDERSVYFESADSDLTVCDCKLDLNGIAKDHLYCSDSDGATRTLTVQDCECVGANNINTSYFLARDLAGLIVRDNSFAGTGIGVWLWEAVTHADIGGNTGTLAGRVVLVNSGWTGAGHIRINGNDLSSDCLVSCIPDAACDDLSFEVCGNTWERGSGVTTGIAFGADDPSDASNTLGRVVIMGNTFSVGDSAGAAHLLLIGGGVNDWVYEANHQLNTGNGDYGLVVKGQRGAILHNRMYGIRPLYLCGAGKTNVQNNSIYATTGAAILIDDQNGVEPDWDRIVNNVLIADGSGCQCFHDGGTGHSDLQLDYNLYWAINGAHVASLSAASKDTVVAMTAYWETAAPAGIAALNDSHSEVGNPRLANVAGVVGDDYTPSYWSPAQNMASHGGDVGAEKIINSAGSMFMVETM